MFQGLSGNKLGFHWETCGPRKIKKYHNRSVWQALLWIYMYIYTIVAILIYLLRYFSIILYLPFNKRRSPNAMWTLVYVQPMNTYYNYLKLVPIVAPCYVPISSQTLTEWTVCQLGYRNRGCHLVGGHTENLWVSAKNEAKPNKILWFLSPFCGSDMHFFAHITHYPLSSDKISVFVVFIDTVIDVHLLCCRLLHRICLTLW